MLLGGRSHRHHPKRMNAARADPRGSRHDQELRASSCCCAGASSAGVGSADVEAEDRPASVGGRARRARQGGARRGAALAATRAFEPTPTRADPIELLERQAETRVPELVPIRYGRMLVSPFTFYRGAALIMAERPRRDAALGADRAVLRRRAPVELRRVRLARAAARVRRQRLRRDAPGPWEWDVKRLAASMLIAARDNGFARQGPGADRARHRRRVPHARWRDFAAMKQPRRLVRAPRHRERAARSSARSSSPSRSSAPRSSSPRRARKDSMSAFSKLTARGRRRSRGSSTDPPLIVPIDELVEGDAARRDVRGAARAAARLPRHARARPARAARAVRAGRLRAQGRRRRQRRHARLDRAAARPRRPGPAVPADEGGRGLGARGVPRRRASSRTTASASSPGSG